MPEETRTRDRGASLPRRQAKAQRAQGSDSGRSRVQALTAGGTDGNERLTGLTGLILIVLLAVLGVTIIRIGQLLWLHLFLGMLLLGPVALKLASTGYRFVRYYTSEPRYRRKGPPAPALRALAPLVVISTLTVFATGVALLALGPSSRGLLVLLHKVSFFAWIAVTALHVLGHLPEIVRLLDLAKRSRAEMFAAYSAHLPSAMRSDAMRSDAMRSDGTAVTQPLPGRVGRAFSIGASLIVGLALAVALIPEFGAWTHWFATQTH